MSPGYGNGLAIFRGMQTWRVVSRVCSWSAELARMQKLEDISTRKIGNMASFLPLLSYKGVV